MSFTRELYDTCYQRQRITQDKRIQQYSLYSGKYNNSAKCRMEQGVVGGRPDSLYTGNLVNLESDLRGQTRKLSNCPSQQYKPTCTLCKCSRGLPCTCPNCKNRNLRNIPACSSGIVNYNH